MHRLDHPIKLLIINPYHIGSHAQWSDDLTYHLNDLDEFEVNQWSLPGKHWKWRMQGAAITCARLAQECKWVPDLILTTDMLHCAAFRGMLPPSWRNIPLIQYFHENQITYPWSPEDPDPHLERDRTYGMINILSALSADHIWFNSEHHRRLFLTALPRFIQPLPDYNAEIEISTLHQKSSVFPIAIEPSSEPRVKIGNRGLNDPPVFLWNHRWDYDKGPDHFHDLLIELDSRGHDFNLILTGSNSSSHGDVISKIQAAFAPKIHHIGYTEDREMYRSLLRQSDFIIHEPRQEYFGISVLEAMSEGVIPILKKGHAYDDWIHPSLAFDHRCRTIQIFEEIHDVQFWRNWAIDTSLHYSMSHTIPKYAQALRTIHVENLEAFPD